MHFSTLIAALPLFSLGLAAPTVLSPRQQGQTIRIVLKLEGSEAFAQVDATLDKTSPVFATKIQEAEVSSSFPGPWCAGFSDVNGRNFVPAINGDGIFNSVNKAVYSDRRDQVVKVSSYWCAATKPEVENFVRRAQNAAGRGGQANNGQGNNRGNNGGLLDLDGFNNGRGNQQNNGGNVQQNNGGNVQQNNGGSFGNGNQNSAGGNPAAIVRVEVELERGTTFVQENLAANQGLVQASSLARNIFGNGEIVNAQVTGQGSCQFFSDARGNRAATFPGRVVSFSCTV